MESIYGNKVIIDDVDDLEYDVPDIITFDFNNPDGYYPFVIENEGKKCVVNGESDLKEKYNSSEKNDLKKEEINEKDTKGKEKKNEGRKRTVERRLKRLRKQKKDTNDSTNTEERSVLMEKLKERSLELMMIREQNMKNNQLKETIKTYERKKNAKISKKSKDLENPDLKMLNESPILFRKLNESTFSKPKIPTIISQKHKTINFELKDPSEEAETINNQREITKMNLKEKNPESKPKEVDKKRSSKSPMEQCHQKKFKIIDTPTIEVGETINNLREITEINLEETIPEVELKQAEKKQSSNTSIKQFHPKKFKIVEAPMFEVAVIQSDNDLDTYKTKGMNIIQNENIRLIDDDDVMLVGEFNLETLTSTLNGQTPQLGIAESMSNVKKAHQCPDCEKTFGSSQSVKLHSMIVHQMGKNGFKCKHCNQLFGSIKFYNMHQALLKKKAEKNEKEKKEEVYCHLCCKILPKREYNTVHKLYHEKPFRCTGCRKTYSSQNNLDLHNKYVHNFFFVT